eukprot:1633928-Rhodomonas_salina.3
MSFVLNLYRHHDALRLQARPTPLPPPLSPTPKPPLSSSHQHHQHRLHHDHRHLHRRRQRIADALEPLVAATTNKTCDGSDKDKNWHCCGQGSIARICYAVPGPDLGCDASSCELDEVSE